jgi:4-amino-4-deoxy-L-arabinose transferase-like glycosyltransferase
MVRALEKNPILTICIFVFIMLLPNLDTVPVTIMEARNFITAREMVTDGNWILTTMNGEPRYQKPPLPTWITAVFGYVSGFKSIYALRFPAILMIIVIGIFTYLLSNRILQHKQQSLINALIAVTSFYVIGITIEAPWDIYTHGFMLIGIYYLFRAFNSDRLGIYFFLSSIFIGFSFLSKGPVSFYALLLPFLIAYGITFKFNKRNVFWLVLILILSLIIGGWWFLYIRIADTEAFLEITKKETGNWRSYNVRPFYYYWSFFSQSGIWTIPAFIGLLYPYLKTRVSNLKVYKFSLLWTVFAVILLSVIPEKKSRYLMPVLIPLAINTGFYIDYLIREFKDLKDKKETIPVYFSFGLLGLIGLIFPILAYSFLKDILIDFWVEYIFASMVLFCIGLFLTINLVKKRFKSVFQLSALLFLSILVTVLPLSKALQNNDSFKSISNLKTTSNNLPIYSYNYYSPEMIWDFGDKIISVENKKKSDTIFGLITNYNTKEDLLSTFTSYNIEHKATFDLNVMKEGNRDYKNRLKADYYILSKKQ